jgi:hypothetical protein
MGDAKKATVDTAQGCDRLIALMRRCDSDKATEKDLADLRAALAEVPDLWRITGDLAQVAQNQILDRLESGTYRESVKCSLMIRRLELAGEDAPLVERLLAEQVVTSWLQLYLTQINYSSAFHGSVSAPVADFWERRLSAVQSRYLRAIETLARVRRLLRPHAMQVNIGAQQVNVMGESKPTVTGGGKADA